MDRAREASINYLFFFVYFFITSFVHVFHAFLIEPSFSFSTCFFVIYALLQLFLETLLLLIGAKVVSLFLPRFLNFYIVFVFFIFLGHLVDFPLVRLMDISFWYALDFISQESYANFIELLRASNVSLFLWALGGIGAIALLLSGIFFYRVTERWTFKSATSLAMLGVTATISCAFLVGWDYTYKPHVAMLYFDRFVKTLPWKSIFLSHSKKYLNLKSPIKKFPTEEETLFQLDGKMFSLVHKPDIYLFVIESLREDYMTAENAPYLHKFKQENVSFKKGFANANATQISWFSLFYSRFPFYWGTLHPATWKKGSIPLQLLKKMGYKIYVSSSSSLAFYQMNQLIFGEKEYLANQMFCPNDEEPYLRDQRAMSHLMEQMVEPEEGRLFITFLDATHFDYSWPKEMTHFTPYVDKVNHFKAALSQKGRHEIINRYRNAIHFVDHQFGTFLQTLQRAPGGEDAVVIVTADHGEEFYEQGNLYHASGLTHPQITPPLYYKFGKDLGVKEKVSCSMSCHMDIFPTLFHYLLGEDQMAQVLQGQSIFKKERWPYTVIARFNASRTPFEYCIHREDEKLIASFEGKDIFSSKVLKVIATKSYRDEPSSIGVDTIHERFDLALDHLFSK